MSCSVYVKCIVILLLCLPSNADCFDDKDNLSISSSESGGSATSYINFKSVIYLII